MKVFLRDIPADGLSLSTTTSGEELGLDEIGVKSLTPLEITADFDRVDEELLVRVAVEGIYELPCARCLEPIRQDRSDEFDLSFEITPRTEFVEYGEDIRQELVILFSTVTRCKENCQGLCPGCGVNLNKDKCKCHDLKS